MKTALFRVGQVVNVKFPHLSDVGVEPQTGRIRQCFLRFPDSELEDFRYDVDLYTPLFSQTRWQVAEGDLFV